MRRELRAVLVAALVAVLVIDPAAACHYYGHSWGYWEPCGSYCEPVSCCGSCECEVVESGSCGCDGEVVREGPPSGAAPRETTAPDGERPMTHSGPSNVHRPVDRMPAPQLPPRPLPPEEEDMQPSRVPPLPSEEPPSSAPSADELFGPPSRPGTEPSTGRPGPSEEPMGPPAEESTEPEPSFERYSPPAEEPSQPSGDELFGPEGEQPAEPAPTDEPMSEPAVDDFFGSPPDESTPPAEEEPVEEEEQPAPVEEKGGLFDDFGAILREPGGFASSELREWVDNTGRYTCRGRLIRMLDGNIQLLKDSGRTTTVPFGRLSQNDLEFVHRQAGAQRAEAFGQTAHVSPLRSGP